MDAFVAVATTRVTSERGYAIASSPQPSKRGGRKGELRSDPEELSKNVTVLLHIWPPNGEKLKLKSTHDATPAGCFRRLSWPLHNGVMPPRVQIYSVMVDLRVS